MVSRNALLGAAVVVTVFASACGGRSSSTADGGTKTDGGAKADAGTGGGSGGGAGGGTGGGSGGGTGGGSGGGSGGGGGGGCQGGPDAGTVTTLIGNLRSGICYGTRVKIEGAVVIAEGGETRATVDGGVAWSFDFWIADPNNPEKAIYVSKFKEDLVVDDQGNAQQAWVAKRGDLVDVEGIFSVYYSEKDRRGSRPGISSGFDMVRGGSGGKLTVTVRGTTTPPTDDIAPTGFGAGLKANPEFAGRRVQIPGPLTITSAAPVGLTRYRSDGGISGSNGFEVTGGVLVNNYYTYRFYDGGTNTTNCNWMAEAAAGKTVTFQNGIAGVWETYTHNPGGQAAAAFVPGTDDAGFTYVLYPVDCATDLQGSAQ